MSYILILTTGYSREIDKHKKEKRKINGHIKGLQEIVINFNFMCSVNRLTVIDLVFTLIQRCLHLKRSSDSILEKIQ